MSLAYKLWKIGSVLDEQDMKAAIRKEPNPPEGQERNFMNIDFSWDGNSVTSVRLNEHAISIEKMFLTQKTGTGLSIFYLYPNMELRLDGKKSVFDKLSMLKNSLESSVRRFANEKNREIINCVIELMESDKESESLATLKKIKNGYYLIWISINQKTIPELMPEVWENWYNEPVIEDAGAKIGYDAFANKEAKVGYKPEFTVFSYDQYHDSLKYRLNENLPLSLESARNIKFAWSYMLKNLIFYYQGLEYIIMPNMVSFNKEAIRIILNRLCKANENTLKKNQRLSALKKQEKNIKKELENLASKLKNKKLEDDKQSEIEALQIEYQKVASEIDGKDVGYITEFKEQVDQLGEWKNSVTLDFIFISVNRTNFSFEIKAAIEDVLPSRLTELVDRMRDPEFNIEDNVTPFLRNREKTCLQDYFNRDELYFILNKSQKNNANRILQERLFLAKLLLTGTTINLDELLRRFQIHREFTYAHKRNMRDGIMKWIDFPHSFTEPENRVLRFLDQLQKIKG